MVRTGSAGRGNRNHGLVQALPPGLISSPHCDSEAGERPPGASPGPAAAGTGWGAAPEGEGELRPPGVPCPCPLTLGCFRHPCPSAPSPPRTHDWARAGGGPGCTAAGHTHTQSIVQVCFQEGHWWIWGVWRRQTLHVMLWKTPNKEGVLVLRMFAPDTDWGKDSQGTGRGREDGDGRTK